MPKFVVDAKDKYRTELPGFGGYAEPKLRSRGKKILTIFGISIILITIIGSISSFFYWRNLSDTPQYSLALLIDAARRDDKVMIDELVDMDAVVDNFLPQITSKAIELYGRGLSPQTIAMMEKIAAPVLPAVKSRARDELPKAIRQKTEKFSNVPFAVMLIGADRYLDITFQGELALVKSKVPEHSFEMTMRKNGQKWKIVGIRDEKLATKIAQKVGQDIIGIASKNSRQSSADLLDIRKINELLKQAEEIFR